MIYLSVSMVMAVILNFGYNLSFPTRKISNIPENGGENT